MRLILRFMCVVFCSWFSVVIFVVWGIIIRLKVLWVMLLIVSDMLLIVIEFFLVMYLLSFVGGWIVKMIYLFLLCWFMILLILFIWLVIRCLLSFLFMVRVCFRLIVLFLFRLFSVVRCRVFGDILMVY